MVGSSSRAAGRSDHRCACGKPTTSASCTTTTTTRSCPTKTDLRFEERLADAARVHLTCGRVRAPQLRHSRVPISGGYGPLDGGSRENRIARFPEDVGVGDSGCPFRIPVAVLTVCPGNEGFLVWGGSQTSTMSVESPPSADRSSAERVAALEHGGRRQRGERTDCEHHDRRPGAERLPGHQSDVRERPSRRPAISARRAGTEQLPQERGG